MQQDAIGRSNLSSSSGGQLEGNLNGREGNETRPASFAKNPYEQKPALLKVLVIEDEENIIELIKLGLRYEGFQVEAVSDGQEGLSTAQRISPDIIILDLGLPPGSIDGLEVCRRLRINPTTQDVPVLMLTAKGEVEDRVAGLKTGADDYLTKPFSFEELVARIHAILRRQRRSSDSLQGDGVNEREGQVLQFGDLRLNLTTREVTRTGRLIELTATEYNLLHLFMSHPRQVLDRQTILNKVWGYDFLGETNIIEVYVRYLREKIEDSPSTPRLIQTVRGVGYVLKG
ncbi:MAG TPA: DNA-binding response regulator [Ktedonobacter sp.]|jgi:DNA-binding response OmpR family regulator|nr:DNA-binding response regulator [Ktedonobacter sp.]HAG97400.1 DNA-binding response regulator [Ktedonobacter sp.]HAT46261.1 DNA-binding response regulator [Ktedonobacter sp.]HBE27016.1 DNA-binding response regulator [Ktedonobacter sp.]HCF87846.1 DNA-binding response regulator [Ktedonobacter sp.]